MSSPAMPNGSSRKKINLALQGGGAYGAFTWGVLDHMLEDGRIEIEGMFHSILVNDPRVSYPTGA
jgi:predicted acylesterase/phospholipase RssA